MSQLIYRSSLVHKEVIRQRGREGVQAEGLQGQRLDGGELGRGTQRKIGNGEMEVVWKCWIVGAPGSCLHPAMLTSASRPSIMPVSLPGMLSISQGHWVAQLQEVPSTLGFMFPS